MTEIKLEHPIQANGETVETITLKRPQVRHLKAVDRAQGDIERAALLIGELAGLPPSAVEQIDAADFARLSEVIGGFFGGSLPTGGT